MMNESATNFQMFCMGWGGGSGCKEIVNIYIYLLVIEAMQIKYESKISCINAKL